MKRRFVILLVLSAVFFVLAAHFLPIYYEDNDDATMAWIASGTYSGQPDCHLHYISAVYGCLLVAFYSVIPSVEWYSVFFGLFQIIAFAVICNYILKTFKGGRTLSLLTILFAACIWIWLISRFQFTTTAGLLAFAAILLLLDRRFWSGGALLVVASAIRFSAAGLVGLVMIPTFIYKYGKEIKRNWMPLAVVLTIVLCFRMADDLFYQSPDWARYREFDSCLVKINDNPNNWRARNHLPDGMPDVNYEMILAYFADPSAVSNQEMKEIVSYLYYDVPFRKDLMNSFRGCFLKYWPWFLFVFLMSFPAILQNKDKRLRCMIVGGFVVWFAVLSVVGFNYQVKNRVFTASFIAMAYYLYSVVSVFTKQGRHALSITMCSVLFVLGIFEFAIPAIKRCQPLAKKAELFKEQLVLVNSVKGYSVVTNGGDFSVEMLPPFNMSDAIEPHVFINPYCYMGSPLNNDRLASHLDLTNDGICMLSRKGVGDFALLKKAIMTNYGVAIDTMHLSESDNYYLIKFIKTDEQCRK